MKGFIEVTELTAGEKYLINVNAIKCISERGGIASIALACAEKRLKKTWVTLSIAVEESYDYIKTLIAEAMRS